LAGFGKAALRLALKAYGLPVRARRPVENSRKAKGRTLRNCWEIAFPPANAQEVLFEEVGGGTALAGIGPE
jgi:hypothetical protein